MNGKNEDLTKEFSIEIEKDAAGVRIRVAGIPADKNMESFRQAYGLVKRLYDGIHDLDLEIELERGLEQARNTAESYWVSEGGTVILSPSVADKSHRIALALLRTYPEPMDIPEVIRNTQVAAQTVRNHLTGLIKVTEEFFESRQGGYQLSRAGVTWVVETVVPALGKQDAESVQQGTDVS